MLDLESLDWQTFEALAILLLRRESYELTSAPILSDRGHDSGVDAIATAPDGKQTFVIVKYSRRRIRTSTRQLQHIIEVAARLRSQFAESNILYISANELTEAALALMDNHGIQVWDRTRVQYLLLIHTDIADTIQKTVVKIDLLDLFQDPEPTPHTNLESRVTTELAGITPGLPQWKSYEKMVAKLLTEIFLNHLDPPIIQNRTDDGLDIMDAVFDIPHTDSSWSQVRTTYNTHFVVAEFKNYADSIGPKQVRQLAEYLWPRAFRMFGIIVSRQKPSDQALAARRRTWLDHEKIIAFLDDSDLIEMARLVDNGQNPYNLVHTQLMSFFRTLNP